MTQPVFSKPFIVQRGVNGDSETVTVPIGHVYVIKQISSYANSTAVEIDVFLRNGATSSALWRGPTEGGTASFNSLECTFAFLEGDSFLFNVVAAPIDSADVYCGGYDLINVG